MFVFNVLVVFVVLVDVLVPVAVVVAVVVVLTPASRPSKNRKISPNTKNTRKQQEK